jgi:hypothetical protein
LHFSKENINIDRSSIFPTLPNLNHSIINVNNKRNARNHQVHLQMMNLKKNNAAEIYKVGKNQMEFKEVRYLS